jgi:hypothetical protein
MLQYLNLPTLFFVLTALAISSQSSASEDFLTDAKTVIDFDATWRFNDLNEDLGEEWIDPDFDDSNWASGAALLGYDTGNRSQRWPSPGLQTNLNQNLITYYFRTTFNYEGTIQGIALQIQQIIDDGAVYYLNGVEIGRSALMPEGPISHLTTAIRPNNPWDEHETILVANPPLRQGQNVLAVSVHNQGVRSSDICFGARVSLGVPTVAPSALYLTWQQDPTTTMTIHWHTEEPVAGAFLYFSASEANGPALKERAESKPMTFSHRFVHTVELTGLKPDSEYHFRLVINDSGNLSPQYSFRTMPATAEKPIRIAIGGDVLHRREWMEEVNREAMRFDPHFIVWGGDLAYADGRADRIDRWYTFFDVMMNTLISDQGRVVPVLFGIGNHEIVGGYYWGADRGRGSYEDTNAFRESIAPFYYNLFAFPGHPGYGVLDFGEYLSILLLDTDHSGPVEGTQTDWLAHALAERTHIPHVLPVYHVTGYPSVRPFDNQTSARIREHWIPLFERFGIEFAFENHDHAYKRTVPILNGKEDPGGIIFIGDGAWGVGERVPREAGDEWYLERSMSMRHLILLSLQDDSRDIKVISREGKIIDHVIDRAGERAKRRD